MAKVHITLVGGYTTPVYQGIIYSNPDKVVFIYSHESRDAVILLKDEIAVPSEMRLFHPVELDEIERKVKLCAKQFEQDEVCINISSGTKAWAYCFIREFADKPNASLLYVDQNALLWDLKENTSQKVHFDMEAQFRLRGNPLTRFKRFADYNDEDMKVLHKIEELRSFSPGDFNMLTDMFENNTNQTEQTLPNGSYLQWDKRSRSFSMCLRKNDGRNNCHILSSPNVRQLLLNTGWFEYKIAKMLSEWDKSREIRLNCEFFAKTNAPKNEVDIIIDVGNKVLFVECKTKLTKPTVIDKFRSVVTSYGGMSSKAIFITDEPMNNTAKEKCKGHNILTFSLKEPHLNMSNEQALFLLLDSELFNINTK